MPSSLKLHAHIPKLVREGPVKFTELDFFLEIEVESPEVKPLKSHNWKAFIKSRHDHWNWKIKK